MQNPLSNLKVKLFADGADKPGMLNLYGNPLIKGLTTNPSLMKKAGITDYESFAKDILKTVKDKPISFEVFSDDFAEMERQACLISKWGEGVSSLSGKRPQRRQQQSSPGISCSSRTAGRCA